MLLKEFLDLGKTCKVCGDAGPKDISVHTIWDEEPRNVEIANDFLTFKMSSDVQDLSKGFQIFRFKLGEHKAEREIHNPKHLSIMFCNNFIFKISCPACNSYSYESGLVTFHPMGSLTSNININSEEIVLNDDGGWYKLKNMVHTDKIILYHKATAQDEGTMDLPFMTLRDFPIKNKTKTLKKIRTLLLLS
jgi:hypothetical protein